MLSGAKVRLAVDLPQVAGQKVGVLGSLVTSIYEIGLPGLLVIIVSYVGETYHRTFVWLVVTGTCFMFPYIENNHSN